MRYIEIITSRDPHLKIPGPKDWLAEDYGKKNRSCGVRTVSSFCMGQRHDYHYIYINDGGQGWGEDILDGRIRVRFNDENMVETERESHLIIAYRSQLWF